MLAAAAALAVLLTQAVHARELLDVHETLTAGFAKALVLGYALAVLALAGAAALVPVARLWIVPAIAALLCAVPVLATLTVGGEAWSFLLAFSVLAAAWQVGAWILARLALPRLAAEPAVAWLLGSAVLGLFLLFAGRIGVLRWWTVGIPVLALAAVALVRATRRLAAGGARQAWAHVTGTRLAAACAAIGLLLLGLASVWTAAPELMFDALYGKVWLPAEWARHGAIEPLRQHPVLNIAGFPQVMAVPGHLVDAGGIGRYLQWLAAAAVVAAIWWSARASPWAPLCALAAAVTPHLFWQATTAYDDAILALVLVGLGTAVVAVLSGAAVHPGREGVVLGALAGACVDHKLHLGIVAATTVLAAVVLGREHRLARLAGVVAGGVAVAAPPLVLRWIDVGNPVLPAYNDVFRSAYWPPVNETLNFPFYKSGTPLDVLVNSVTEPSLMTEAAPAGAFGVLLLAVVGVVLVGWRGTPATRAIWVALVVGLVAWYVQTRYLRYLLPLGALALVAVGSLASVRPLTRRTELLALGAACALAIALWPATVAQFWNVPGRDLPWKVALRLEDDDTYERASTTARELLTAFNAVAPPDAAAVTRLYQRTWVEDDRDLSPFWELKGRLMLRGELPTSAPELREGMQALGLDWLILKEGDVARPSDQDVISLVESGADAVWADQGWTIYTVAPAGAERAAVTDCDPGLRGRPDCWQGTLDPVAGYRAEESPQGIRRELEACPGQTLQVEVESTGAQDGTTLVRVDHDSAPALGHMIATVRAGSAEIVAGTAPAGATRAVVTVLPGPGVLVEGVRIFRRGRCG